MTDRTDHSEVVGHTPGPWFWALDRHNRTTTLRRSGSGDVVLSAQADVGEYGLRIDEYVDVSDADAALIASAPALLEALKLIEKNARQLAEDKSQSDTSRRTWKLCEDEARAAIQAATGGSDGR